MSTLLLLLPERQRLAGAAPAPAGLFDWRLLAADGSLLGEGQAAAEALPVAEQLVLLLPELGLSWLRAPLPRAPRKQLRAALVGLLEEQLLEDPEALHFALPEGATPGEPSWIAITPLAPLREALQRLEAAGRFVDRIAPRAWPRTDAEAHVLMAEATPLLRYAHAEGLNHLPLAGELAKQLLPAELALSASPAAAAAAEAWRGAAVRVRSEAETLQQALAGPWNLRQGELAPQLHGLRWLQQGWHRFLQPDWRAARLGLLLLLITGLLGLNLLAWQQKRQLAERQQQLESTLKQAFPQIAYVADAPLQMQRELGALRTQAGALGEQDLEALIAALAVAWPAERGPLEALSYENGRLSLPAAGWSEAQTAQLRQALASEGWQLQAEAGRLSLQRSRP